MNLGEIGGSYILLGAIFPSKSHDIPKFFEPRLEWAHDSLGLQEMDQIALGIFDLVKH